VLNRITGEIALRRGPLMLLCNPRDEVIVRRVLAPGTVALWYPGNAKVLEVNKMLAAMEDVRNDPSAYEAGRPTVASVSMNALYAAEEQAVRTRTVAGETFNRSGKFTPPRTITLDTKYEGAVGIAVWTGYAVLVISKTGTRRVEVGPTNLLLEYDETLAPLELSTGKPKNDTTLFRTVYLRVTNNKVSDVIEVETQDLVKVRLTVSYRVNFEGDDHEKWFAVENYVKLLTDHLRSKIRNVAKRTGVEAFYGNTSDIIRDSILGKAEGDKPRAGCAFSENGMRVYDVEILDVSIQTADVATLLHGAQKKALSDVVGAVEQERRLEIVRRTEAVKQAIATLTSDTAEAVAKEEQRQIGATLSTSLARIEAETTSASTRLNEELGLERLNLELASETVKIQKLKEQTDVEVKRAQIELALSELAGQTDQIVKRAGAVSAELAEALTAFSDKTLAKEIAIALAPVAAMQGVSAVDVLGRLFDGTPLKHVLDSLGSRSELPIGTAAKQQKAIAGKIE
jgi:major vault protein